MQRLEKTLIRFFSYCDVQFCITGGKDKAPAAPQEEQVTSVFIPSIEAAVQDKRQVISVFISRIEAAVQVRSEIGMRTRRQRKYAKEGWGWMQRQDGVGYKGDMGLDAETRWGRMQRQDGVGCKDSAGIDASVIKHTCSKDA
eukprot:436382-Pelagomonas_calceolata.AAC.6